MKKITILAMAVFLFSAIAAKAQISFGAGVSALKILSEDQTPPFQLGTTVKLGIDVGEYVQLVATPTLFFPTDHVVVNEPVDATLPAGIETTQRLRVFQVSALFMYNIIGMTNDPASLYVGLGPGVATYNMRVMSDGKNEGPDVVSSSSDLLIDTRLGGEVELVQPLRMFAEVAVAPVIATNIEEGVDNIRPRGTMFFPSIGLRLPIGPRYRNDVD